MDGSAFNDLGKAIFGMIVMLFVALPLAAWKVIEIIAWLVKHVEINWN